MDNPHTDPFHTAMQRAWHMEMRDGYMPSDPEFHAFQRGEYNVDDDKDLVEWCDLVRSVRACGVQMRRVRIVSEPLSDYVRYELECTRLNVAAGEEVRWLPRVQASDLLLPGNDFWLFDSTVRFVHFAGSGELADDPYTFTEAPEIVAQVADAFERVWARAIPHEHYRPRG